MNSLKSFLADEQGAEMRVRIKNDLSKWSATRELRKRPANMSRREWHLVKQSEALIRPYDPNLLRERRDEVRL